MLNSESPSSVSNREQGTPTSEFDCQCLDVSLLVAFSFAAFLLRAATRRLVSNDFVKYHGFLVSLHYTQLAKGKKHGTTRAEVLAENPHRFRVRQEHVMTCTVYKLFPALIGLRNVMAATPGNAKVCHNDKENPGKLAP